MSKKPKAAVVDIDDTISRFLYPLIVAFNDKYGTAYSENDLEDWNLTSLDPRLEKFFKELEAKGLYAGLPIILEAKRALDNLREWGFHIILMTARQKQYQEITKTRLLWDDIPYDEIMFIKHKAKKIKELSETYNIVMFADDKYSTVLEVAKKCDVDKVGLVLKSHNENLSVPDGVERIRTILDLVNKLKPE